MSLDKNKTDSELGIKVLQYLTKMEVHTPGQFLNLDESEQIQAIEPNIRAIMITLGLDLDDDSLVDTPTRVAKMYVREIFWGLNPSNFPKCTTVDNKIKHSSMVVERNVSVQSNCEHHFVVICGKAQVGYIPKDKVLGLSKINRIVEYFSKRPQIQERLTEQIYHALSFILETDDVAVVISAEHYCVKSRGVEDEESDTVTAKMGGQFFTDSTLRSEFYQLLKR